MPVAPTVFTTLSIFESALPIDDTTCKAQGNFNRCYTADIDIPLLQFPGNGTGTITFLIEPAAVKNFKERNLLLTHDGNPVGFCSASSPVAPPCIDTTTVYKAKPGTVPAIPDGTVEIKVLINGNGLWNIR
jgi:hypothetical protein